MRRRKWSKDTHCNLSDHEDVQLVCQLLKLTDGNKIITACRDRVKSCILSVCQRLDCQWTLSFFSYLQLDIGLFS